MKCVSVSQMGGDQESLTYNCGDTSGSFPDVAPSSLGACSQDFAVYPKAAFFLWHNHPIMVPEYIWIAVLQLPIAVFMSLQNTLWIKWARFDIFYSCEHSKHLTTLALHIMFGTTWSSPVVFLFLVPKPVTASWAENIPLSWWLFPSSVGSE